MYSWCYSSSLISDPTPTMIYIQIQITISISTKPRGNNNEPQFHASPSTNCTPLRQPGCPSTDQTHPNYHHQQYGILYTVTMLYSAVLYVPLTLQKIYQTFKGTYLRYNIYQRRYISTTPPRSGWRMSISPDNHIKGKRRSPQQPIPHIKMTIANLPFVQYFPIDATVRP